MEHRRSEHWNSRTVDSWNTKILKHWYTGNGTLQHRGPEHKNNRTLKHQNMEHWKSGILEDRTWNTETQEYRQTPEQGAPKNRTLEHGTPEHGALENWIFGRQSMEHWNTKIQDEQQNSGSLEGILEQWNSEDQNTGIPGQ